MKKLYLAIALVGCLGSGSLAQQLDHVLGDLIVQLEPEANVRLLAERLQTFRGEPTQLKVVKQLSPPMRIWLLHFDFARIHEREFLEHVWRQPEVQVAQVNHLISMRQTVPDDPLFGMQWQWVNTGQSGGTPDADVDADLAWDLTTGGLTAAGDEIVVCVVEGADRSHPDLQGNLWVNEEEVPGNGLDDDGNGYIDDYNGWNPLTNNDVIPAAAHGTFVSGMIGAVGNNASQVTGINWNVKIMHVEIGQLTEANVIESYTYPLIMRKRYNESNGEHGAFVVATNSSWGIDQGDPNSAPLWCAFYDSLGVQGILSVAATANAPFNIDEVGDLPTACSSEYMIAVTATNHNDVRTFSGFGVETIDLGAPGEDVFNIFPGGDPGPWTGTSFSTPLVAGVVALMYSAPCPSLAATAQADPAVAALLVRDYLFEGVDTLPNLVPETKTGGRVNAFNALQLIMANCGPCPPPLSVQVHDLLDTSAVLSWVSTDSTRKTSLRYRLSGDTVWTSFDSVISPFTFTGLLPCTTYEFQLLDECRDTSSGFTEVEFFTTDGCCVHPEGLQVLNVEDTTALGVWASVLAANTYNLLLVSEAGDSTLFEGLTEPSLQLPGLDSCVNYQLFVQTVCDTGGTAFSPPVSFRTFGCGACTDLTYCPSKASNASEEWIGGVLLADLNNITDSDAGYGDYTGLAANLQTYGIYELTLIPEFSGPSFGEYWRVWVDYNQDGDFDDENELAFDAGQTSQDTVRGTLVVPGEALEGLTRMRVSMKFNDDPDPCENGFNFGEVEDYCVLITAGQPPECAVPQGLDTTSVNLSDAFLTWEPTPSTLSYNLRYRPTGSPDWLELNGSATSAQLTGLDVCTEYEVQVEAVCPGSTSGFSESFLFSTDCYPPCTAVPANLDTLEVGETFLRLQWEGTPNATAYRLQYRLSGTPDWNEVETLAPTADLEDLMNCSTYELRVAALCLGGESDFSEIVSFSTLCPSATQELFGGKGRLRLFPNPADEFLSLELELTEQSALQIRLLDLRGQEVAGWGWKTFPEGRSLEVLQLPDLPAGLYLLQVGNGEGASLRKLLLN